MHKDIHQHLPEIVVAFKGIDDGFMCQPFAQLRILEVVKRLVYCTELRRRIAKASLAKGVRQSQFDADLFFAPQITLTRSKNVRLRARSSSSRAVACTLEGSLHEGQP